MKKIITSYNIVDGDYVAGVDDERTIDNIIKIPVVSVEETVIENKPEEPPPEPEPEPKETVLQLFRNNEGIVVGIEVQCTCGEKILIKMEY